MCSSLNGKKSVIAKRFIRTLKNKIYRYTTSVSRYVYIDKLSTIKMKAINVKHIYWLIY